MPQKKKQKKEQQEKKDRYTALAKHQRKGSTLVSPLGERNIQPIDWPRDLLPEHLWVAALADVFSIESAHNQFYEFMDILDSFIPEGSHALGLLSDFSLVPMDRREEFWSHHHVKIEELFHKPIGRILAFYPANPANWLVSSELIVRGGFLDPEIELNRLRNLVLKLFPGKDHYAGRLRALPFGRIVKHGLIKIPRGFPVVDFLPKYPTACTDEEKYRVEQFARISVNMMYMEKDHYKDKLWSQYFWRHNFDLVICKPQTYYIMGSKPMTEEHLPSLVAVLESNAKIARAYVTDLWKRVTCDLYDTDREEILFGLFSRLVRLYCLIVEDPQLWSRDTGGIMLRCLAECAITFAYLVTCGDEEDFHSFKEYGEGQEKLLMLHLQDNYEGETTLDGRDSTAISEELGGFSIEMMNIELGHWTKKDTRKLATDAGMERFYRLIFSPTSSDVHGTWLSLKHSSLNRCAEPLHRFHRLPSYTEPPAYISIIQIAQQICHHCITLAVEKLGYPKLSPEFQDIPISNETDADKGEEMASM